ncbi:MAG TPA: DJ-1/PfpI family protein, partial [Sphingomonas sp.]|uniref:DJ-1/PfpI family protein n=1 Tax=Sphingomonas sp. TaxID=28214 RepID=UPI002BA94BFC
MFVPALHLWAEVHVRLGLRLQGTRARYRTLRPLIAQICDQAARPGPVPGSGRHPEGNPMRFKFLACGAMPLAFGVSLAIPTMVVAVPALSAVSAADGFVLPAPKVGRHRPLIAILADNGGAQTTDFIVPYGVLKDSDVADVRSVSTRTGTITLTRGLRITADETIAAFDAREAAGADIVIVPAQADPRNAVVAGWLRTQAAKGATIISVCDGARVLANAGLLDGRRAVTHWASFQGMAKSYPTTNWIKDRRYLQDGPIISTAGVTASIPMSLALVDAIGGHAAAIATAHRFGVEDWGSAHRTTDFSIEKSDIA